MMSAVTVIVRNTAAAINVGPNPYRSQPAELGNAEATKPDITAKLNTHDE
jgi:hypothetical protein